MCPKGRGLMSVLFSVVSSGLEQDTVGRYSTNIEWMNGGFREQNSHLKKSKFGDSLENVENSTALGPLSHTDRSVELRTGCPASTEHGLSHRPPSPLLPPPLLENVSYKNHCACTLFWSREIFLFPCVCLKGPAAHPRLHYTLRKYEDICSSLNTPHCLIHLGRYIYNTPFWNAFPSFSPLKTSHPAPVNGTLKNREVRMERWEETRSCGTIFFYIKEFLGLFSVNGRKQLNGYKSVLERGTEMPCHGACEILIWYIYV